MQTEVLSGYVRSMRLFAVCRVVLALLIAMWVPLAQQGAFKLELTNETRFFTIALAYLSIALMIWATNRWLSVGYKAQLLVSTLVDILFIGFLMYHAGGSRNSFAILLIAPVAAAAVLATQVQAMFFAAAATLVLLLESGWRWLDGESPDVGNFLQAALIGGAAFLSSFLINRLAVRLAQQERIVEQRDLDLREQLVINQRIISELQEGVIILDEQGDPRTMNSAAERLVGGIGVQLPKLATGAKAIPWDVPSDDNRLGRKVLLRTVDSGLATKAGVVFVQDQQEVEHRAQQLKLASMGRLSASIAHEIRNPLSAIRHANGLIAEMAASPELADHLPRPVKRLTAMVEANTVRINRIIEDVLSLARRNAGAIPVEDLPSHELGGFVMAWLTEWSEQEGVNAKLVTLKTGSADRLPFDPNHLRQVLVNLVGNAKRYCSSDDGAIAIKWRSIGALGELIIADDGPGLSESQRQHLFEPFYSSESTGVGLGLYLARELCAANGAELVYAPFVDEEIDIAQQAFIIRSNHVVSA
jgi:two-component system, NtrC family, sensor histidine kinase PilS